jgi:hypothetical protein
LGSKNKILLVTCEEYINIGSLLPKIKAGSPNLDFAKDKDVLLTLS